MNLENKEKVTLWSSLIVLVVEIAVTWFCFVVLTTWNLALWAQVIVGIVAFLFAISAIKIILGYALMLALAIYIHHNQKKQDRKLKNVNIEDEYEEVDDEII